MKQNRNYPCFEWQLPKLFGLEIAHYYDSEFGIVWALDYKEKFARGRYFWQTLKAFLLYPERIQL